MTAANHLRSLVAERMITTRLLVALALALAGAVPSSADAAQVAALSIARAEAGARAALAPAAVDGVLCQRPTSGRARKVDRRAFCLVAHPAPEGTICRSLVDVKATAEGLRTRVIHASVCMHLELARPIDRG